MQISEEKIKNFQKEILIWYSENKRDLPWRQTRDPYNILISEVMSQQTQLSRVVPKFLAWMEKFPTIQDLAKASVSDVLHYWSGLGYNRRALNLKKTAEKINLEFNEIFPKTEKELLGLPGIGQYTARAILCFAFDEQIAVVDTNVRKVIMTHFRNELGIMNYESGENQKNKNHDSLFMLHDSPKEKFVTEKEIGVIAQTLLPHGLAYDWNQALMDYSSAVLKKEKIPIPKQSKFHGSHRYYRGQILKVLLKDKKVTIKDLGLLIKKDYKDDEEDWLRKLVEELEREGFIFIKNNHVELSP